MSTITHLRSYRIFGVAVFDLMSSFAIAFVLAKAMKWPVDRVLYAVVPVSIASHVLVGQDSVFTDAFFDADRHWFFKAVVAALGYKALA